MRPAAEPQPDSAPTLAEPRPPFRTAAESSTSRSSAATRMQKVGGRSAGVCKSERSRWVRAGGPAAERKSVVKL